MQHQELHLKENQYHLHDRLQEAQDHQQNDLQRLLSQYHQPKSQLDVHIPQPRNRYDLAHRDNVHLDIKVGLDHHGDILAEREGGEVEKVREDGVVRAGKGGVKARVGERVPVKRRVLDQAGREKPQRYLYSCL